MDGKTLQWVLIGGAALLLLPSIVRTAGVVNAATGTASNILIPAMQPGYVFTQPMQWLKNLGDDDRWFS